ncbi:MAG: hypothetical protein SNJ57_03480 [Cyanobacteriota bacterium]
MDLSKLQAALFQEIQQVPEDKLPRLYELIHSFRLSAEASSTSAQATLAFAGCWSDLPEQDYTDFTEEIVSRRQQAFSRRRGDEISAD